MADDPIRTVFEPEHGDTDPDMAEPASCSRAMRPAGRPGHVPRANAGKRVLMRGRDPEGEHLAPAPAPGLSAPEPGRYDPVIDVGEPAIAPEDGGARAGCTSRTPRPRPSEGDPPGDGSAPVAPLRGPRGGSAPVWGDRSGAEEGAATGTGPGDGAGPGREGPPVAADHAPAPVGPPPRHGGPGAAADGPGVTSATTSAASGLAPVASGPDGPHPAQPEAGGPANPAPPVRGRLRLG